MLFIFNTHYPSQALHWHWKRFSFCSSVLVIIVHRPIPACTASSRPSRSMHFGEVSEKNGRENLFSWILRHAYFRESRKEERLTSLESRTQSSAQTETKCLTCPSFGYASTTRSDDETGNVLASRIYEAEGLGKWSSKFHTDHIAGPVELKSWKDVSWFYLLSLYQILLNVNSW